jgi:hypothetical protein
MPSYQKPESTPAKKALDFGDPVPLPTRPEAPAALPPAAAPLEIENNGAKPGVLEFDGPATPQPAPVPDLLLDNSKARPVILDLDDQAAPATPPPAMPAPALETPATKKVLTF